MTDTVMTKLKRLLDPKLFAQLAIAGGLTVGVKGVAFLKELAVARQFGTSDDLDAFLVAVMIPTIIAFIVGDAFRDAVIPAYSKLRVEGNARSSKLISNTLWICGAGILVVTLLSIAFSRPLIELLTDNFSPEKQERSHAFLRILFPFAICFALSSVLKGYLQSHDRFTVSSIAPALIPAATILVLLFSPNSSNGFLLAIGASLGAALLVLLLCWDARNIKGARLLKRPGWDRHTRSVVHQAFPLLAGGVVMEGCFFVDTMMATSLEAGSVATLSYGERICTIVMAIGGTTAGNVLFPHVADLIARESWKSLTKVVVRFSGLIVILALPFVFVFWVAAEPIVRLLLERGQFTAEDTARVADVLRFASFQIPGAILAVLGGRVTMAMGANRFLLLTTCFGLALNIFLNLLFMQWFGLKGIALSTAVVTFVTAIALYLYFFLRVRRLVSNLENN